MTGRHYPARRGPRSAKPKVLRPNSKSNEIEGVQVAKVRRKKRHPFRWLDPNGPSPAQHRRRVNADRIIVAINNGGDLIEAKYRNRLTALSTGAAGIRGAISGVARWRVEAGQLAINLGQPADKGGRLV